MYIILRLMFEDAVHIGHLSLLAIVWLLVFVEFSMEFEFDTYLSYGSLWMDQIPLGRLVEFTATSDIFVQ